MNDISETAKNAAAEAENAADKAGNADSQTVEKAGKAVQQSTIYRTFVTVGLLAYGFVHLMIAFISAQIAWGGDAGGQEASNSGALQQVAQQPMGSAVLIVCAIGLAALVIWQLIEAAIGNQQYADKKRLWKRCASACRAAVYAALCFTAVRAVTGNGGNSENKQEGVTGKILTMPGGVAIVLLIALIIAAVGVGQIVTGVLKSFEDDLDGGVHTWVKRLGQIGYITKGLAIILVGSLFGWAAVSHDPDKAGGTNSALRTLVDQPFGPYLLTLAALGLAAFGAFCAVWAFNARHEKPKNN